MDFNSISASQLTPKILAGRLFAAGMTGAMYILGEEGDDDGASAGAIASFVEADPGAGLEMLELVAQRTGVTLIHHPEWEAHVDLIEMLAHVNEPEGGMFHWQCFGRGGSMVYVVLVAGGEAVTAMHMLQSEIGLDETTGDEDELFESR
jgi:hypothetical protein